MLRGGVGSQPHAGAHEQGAEPAADVPGGPPRRQRVAQELVSLSREDPSSVCVGRQHSNVLFST